MFIVISFLFNLIEIISTALSNYKTGSSENIYPFSQILFTSKLKEKILQDKSIIYRQHIEYHN